MITASYQQCDPLPDPHTGNLTMMWERKGYLPAVGTLERNRSLHGTIRYTAFSWQNSSVCQKGSETLFLQMIPDILLILGQLDCLLECIVINSRIK